MEAQMGPVYIQGTWTKINQYYQIDGNHRILNNNFCKYVDIDQNNMSMCDQIVTKTKKK